MKNTLHTTHKTLRTLFLVLLLSSVWGNSWGQFNINAGSTNYTQDFNTLTNGTWSDNTTLVGWYAKTNATASITAYAANTGTTTSAGLYAFGIAGTNPLTDRGLGFAPTNAYTGASGVGKGYMGWRLKNNTGSPITSISVTWSGEQWRKDNTVDQTLKLFYQAGTTVTDLTAGSWNDCSSTFTSPIKTSGAAALDGNAPANRVANITVTITVNIPTGEEIMLRWEDLNDSGNDHYMAIDDITINATIAAGNTAPTVTTQAVSAIGTTTATGNGNITATGGVDPTVRGFCWDLAANADPDISDPKVEETGTFSTGAFTGNITGLTAGTQYKVRAFATNTEGTSYGSVQTFYSLFDAPTTQASNITFGSISSTGMTTSWTNGNGAKRIVIINTSNNFTNPTDGTDPTANTVYSGSGEQVVYNGSGSSVAVTGLIASTTYWYRVYEYNGSGATTKYLTSAATNNPNSQITSAPSPLITVNPTSLSGFTYVQGSGPSTSQTYSLAASNLTPADDKLTVAGSTNYEVSTDGSTYFPSVKINYTGGTVGATTIYVRLKEGLSTGNYNGENVTNSGGGATTVNVVCSGSVSAPPTPVITVSTSSLSGFSYVNGAGPSTEQSFNVSGSDMTANLVIDGTTNYEISESAGSGYSNQITLTPSGNAVPSTPIYVRLKSGLSVGAYNSQNIYLNTTGATQKNVTCNGNVYATEPTNHATGLTATPDSYSQITTVWTDASSGQIPSGYLVKAAIDPATPVAPGDGVPETDALLVKNIPQGVQQALFTGLNPGTKYNFAIWPYSNSGAAINYKTVPDAPTTLATTNSFTPPNHLVIAEIYGGGGNSGSVLSYDYVVLYNPTSVDVTLTGWSIQYGSNASTAPTLKADLSGFITAYGYYVVRGAIGATPSSPLPVSYDADEALLTLSATNGKIVLSNQNALLANYTDASIVDLVGFGTANSYEGSAAAPQISNTTCIRRKDNSASNTYGITNGYDTDDNANNFYVATPTFANGPVRVYNYSSSAAMEAGAKGTYTRISLIGAGTIVTVSGNSAINSSLTINSGKLEILSTGQLTCTNATINNAAGNSGLVLKSTSTGTGSLIHSTAGVNATIDRYITGAPEQANATQYHLVSYPFRANYLSSEWTGSYLFDLSEASGQWGAVGANPNYQCYSTKGYLLYYPAASTTYTHTGVLKEDASTLPVTRTGASAYPGFNVLPNPYPCALDFNVGAAWSSNIQDNKIWCWSASSGNYGAFIRSGSGTLGVTNIIPVGQAFFVQATASGDVTIATTAKTHSSQAYYKTTEATSNLLRLKTSANTFADEIIVQFRPDATTGYDAAMEAIKMTGQQEAPQLSATSADGENLSINALPFSSEDVIVPLNFSLVPAGEVTFTASGIESFESSVPMYLEDLAQSKVINLREQANYTFSHSGGDAGQRFQLRFKGVNNTPDQPTATEGSVFVSQGYLYIEVPSMQQTTVRVRVYDALGREFSEGKYTHSGLLQLPAPTATGVYVVRVQSGNKVFTAKVVVK